MDLPPRTDDAHYAIIPMQELQSRGPQPLSPARLLIGRDISKPMIQSTSRAKGSGDPPNALELIGRG